MNTIRELKQQEKYKTMLKRKNKEKKIYKDKNASLQFEKQKLYRALLNREREIERLNIKYSKALELLIDYNLPCEVDDFMNVHSDYCETNCGVDEEQYKRCWNKFIEWKLGSE